MTKYLVYSHAPVPPANIKPNTWYSLEELQERFDIEYIKTFFSTANFAWEDLDEKKVSNLKKDNKQ